MKLKHANYQMCTWVLWASLWPTALDLKLDCLCFNHNLILKICWQPYKRNCIYITYFKLYIINNPLSPFHLDWFISIHIALLLHVECVKVCKSFILSVILSRIKTLLYCLVLLLLSLWCAVTIKLLPCLIDIISGQQQCTIREICGHQLVKDVRLYCNNVVKVNIFTTWSLQNKQYSTVVLAANKYSWWFVKIFPLKSCIGTFHEYFFLEKTCCYIII